MYGTVLYKTAITFVLWKICARKAIELAREIVIRAQSGVAQFRTRSYSSWDVGAIWSQRKWQSPCLLATNIWLGRCHEWSDRRLLAESMVVSASAGLLARLIP